MGNERFDISIPKEYLTRDKARLLYVSSATYGGDWISTPHTHYCSELFYVIDGVGQFQVEDNIFPVSANDLVVINPNVSHTELGFNANPLKYIVLGIEGLELSVENNNANFCIVNFRMHRKIFKKQSIHNDLMKMREKWLNASIYLNPQFLTCRFPMADLPLVQT